MVLGVPVVSSDDCRLHEPGAEIWVGVRTPGTEVPARVDAIRVATAAAGAPQLVAEPHDDTGLAAVHSPELVHYLRNAWQGWESSGLLEDPGQDRVVPYFVPMPEMRSGLPLREPVAVHARAGAYCYDTMTLVGPGTWEAVRAAVDVALTAVDLVVGGAAAAYALCRPPGHHATRGSFGGSCYVNNAAVAACELRASGAERVAVIDIDAHHGNGTQSLFYDRPDVFYASLHVDPGAGWFPHVAGFADETGRGDGRGTTLNRPLPPGTGDEGWLAALERDLRAGVGVPAGCRRPLAGGRRGGRRSREPASGDLGRVRGGRSDDPGARSLRRDPGRWLRPGGDRRPGRRRPVGPRRVRCRPALRSRRTRCLQGPA